MDKASIIRTVLLFVALVNQFLVMFGKEPLPIDEAALSGLWDTIYTAGSYVFTFIVSIWTWWKNNYISSKGKAQKEVLKQKGLY